VPIEEETLGIHSNFHFDEEGMDEESSQLIRKLLEEDRLEQNLRETGVSLSVSSKTQLNGGNGKERYDLQFCIVLSTTTSLVYLALREILDPVSYGPRFAPSKRVCNLYERRGRSMYASCARGLTPTHYCFQRQRGYAFFLSGK